MSSKFSILLLLCILIIRGVNTAFSQKSTIIKHISKSIIKENIEASSESVAKNKLKDIGLNFTEKVIAKQTVRKIAREKLSHSIKKQGFKSFKDYAYSNASRKLLKSKTSSFSRKAISPKEYSYKNKILSLREDNLKHKSLQDIPKDTKFLKKEYEPFDLPNCINRKLAGQTINGVKYKLKEFKIHGVYVRGVFPVFDGIKVTLSDNVDFLYKKMGNTDSKFYKGTMREATKKLKLELEKHPELKKQFTQQQLKDIYAEKERINGKIWHHYEELDKNRHPIMQLVDEEKHAACKHTGGSYTWNENIFRRKYSDDWENAKE